MVAESVIASPPDYLRIVDGHQKTSPTPFPQRLNSISEQMGYALGKRLGSVRHGWSETAPRLTSEPKKVLPKQGVIIQFPRTNAQQPQSPTFDEYVQRAEDMLIRIEDSPVYQLLRPPVIDAVEVITKERLLTGRTLEDIDRAQLAVSAASGLLLPEGKVAFAVHSAGSLLLPKVVTMVNG